MNKELKKQEQQIRNSQPYRQVHCFFTNDPNQVPGICREVNKRRKEPSEYEHSACDSHRGFQVWYSLQYKAGQKQYIAEQRHP